ncbi:hypothetical protein TRM7615_01136 [Falsiruegeria mediterranea M17]|uniref:HTH cro/C1-type domain-containing protein n=1 Tax=Falsiruegeria mediterranea M17 TaxID=1200281 RepID=A0A2R8C5L0_9RHOB|nr:hypothetical protein TRM7615_01136 [Falsiruegeria mediterranea M17]
MTQRERYTRDLRILKAKDEGLTQAQICERFGCSRGLLTKLFGKIRQDQEKEARHVG